MEKLQTLTETLFNNIEKVIVGKKEVIKLAIISLLCQGHVLLEDVPGMGKTMLVRTLAKTLGCTFNRIQFTPDLLPSDVLGVSIYNQKIQEFEFRAGPVMAQVLLADEINRTSPRTQAALLECMEEEQITVDGKTYRLPRPFMIMATQNPIEYEGTYPLPEAQLDRFMMKVNMGYPSYEQEMEILERLQKKHPIEEIKEVFTIEDLTTMQKEVWEVHIEKSLQEYIVRIVQETRNHSAAALGASPRGSLALLKGSRAYAALEGRTFVIPDDIKYMAKFVLAHRIVLRPEAMLRGITQEKVVEEVLHKVPLEV